MRSFNTHAITCNFSDNKKPFDSIDGITIDYYYWGNKKTMIKYKLEPKGKHILYPKMEKYIRIEKYEHKTKEFDTTQESRYKK